MTIKEAVLKIAQAETLTGMTAQLVLNGKQHVIDFADMIYDQYNREGNREHLISFYGEEAIETIVHHAKQTKLETKLNNYEKEVQH